MLSFLTLESKLAIAECTPEVPARTTTSSSYGNIPNHGVRCEGIRNSIVARYDETKANWLCDINKCHRTL